LGIGVERARTEGQLQDVSHEAALAAVRTLADNPSQQTVPRAVAAAEQVFEERMPTATRKIKPSPEALVAVVDSSTAPNSGIEWFLKGGVRVRARARFVPASAPPTDQARRGWSEAQAARNGPRSAFE
jgi:hypothetical protein